MPLKHNFYNFIMSTLAESISLLSANASFEPVDPQERLVTEGDAYLWPVDASELTRLKKVFNDNSIVLGGTYVSRPRENCHSCGKREEFIGTVYTAAKGGVHDDTFMKKVLKGEIPAVGAMPHSVVCSHCDATALKESFWESYHQQWLQWHDSV